MPDVVACLNPGVADAGPVASAFELKSSYAPAGDQPAAIAKLTGAALKGEKHQVLLGVTGSGKTFTMANVIRNVKRPTLIIAQDRKSVV